MLIVLGISYFVFICDYYFVLYFVGCYGIWLFACVFVVFVSLLLVCGLVVGGWCLRSVFVFVLIWLWLCWLDVNLCYFVGCTLAGWWSWYVDCFAG